MWIQFYDSTVNHEKTRHLSRLLNQSRNTTLGLLTFLWMFAAQTGDENGVLRYITPGDLANAVNYDGDPETLIDALCNAGFLARGEDPETLIVTGWRKWQTALVDGRKKGK